MYRAVNGCVPFSRRFDRTLPRETFFARFTLAVVSRLLQGERQVVWFGNLDALLTALRLDFSGLFKPLWPPQTDRMTLHRDAHPFCYRDGSCRDCPVPISNPRHSALKLIALAVAGDGHWITGNRTRRSDKVL
jgi:hypothetical protein